MTTVRNQELFGPWAECTVGRVVDRACWYPDDHVDTADPEIVDPFVELNLSALRWPGRNFTSDCHWCDGVGPIEEQPTKPDPAWDALETNRFGPVA